MAFWPAALVSPSRTSLHALGHVIHVMFKGRNGIQYATLHCRCNCHIFMVACTSAEN